MAISTTDPPLADPGAAPRVTDTAGQARARLRAERSRRRTTRLLLTPAILWVVVAVVAPLLLLVWVSFWTVDGPNLNRTIDFSTWSSVLGSGTYRSIVLQTLKIVLIVLAIVAVLGLAAGYFLARFVRSRQLQTILLMLAILPFWTSYVIRIITWQPLFGSKGFLNWLLTSLGIIDEPASAFLYNQTALVVAMSSMYIVFVVGPVFWAFSRIDQDVLAASRSLGASRWKTFLRVELPLAKGGLVAGCFFATIFLLGDYATEQLVGGGTNPSLSGTVNAIGGSGQWPVAAALAIVLLLVSVVLLGILMKIHDLRKEL